MPMHRYIYGTTPVQYDWRHHEPRIPRRNYPWFIDQYKPYIRGFHIHRHLWRPHRVLAEILFSPPRFDSYHHLISQYRYSHYPHQFGQAES